MNVKIIWKHFIKSFGKVHCCVTDFYIEISTGWKSISLHNDKILTWFSFQSFPWLILWSLPRLEPMQPLIRFFSWRIYLCKCEAHTLANPTQPILSMFSAMNYNDNTHHLLAGMRKVCSQLRSEFWMTQWGLLCRERHAHWRKNERSAKLKTFWGLF